MTERVNTVIVGGGQAGLAASYHLTQQDHDHVVLEQAAQAGNVWRNGRRDSFTLLTPNWAMRLPGAEYRGDDPGGFMPRAEIVRYFEGYVERFKLPVCYGVRVTAVEQKPNGNGYIFDYSLVKLPVLDGDGYPVQRRGVTHYPGLYFVGLPWLHTYKSGLLIGVGEDAAFVASRIVASK